MPGKEKGFGDHQADAAEMDEDEPMDISGDSFNDSTYYTASPFRIKTPGKPSSLRHSVATSSPATNERHSLRNIRPLTERKQHNHSTPPRTSLGQSRYRGQDRKKDCDTLKDYQQSAEKIGSSFNDLMKDSGHGHSHGSKQCGSNYSNKNTHSDQKSKKSARKKEELISRNQKLYIFFGLFVVYFGFHFIYSYVSVHRCRVYLNMKELHDTLNSDVFGQEIAVDAVHKVMQDIYNHFQRSQNSTHHVLAFFGWTGVGKNHVTRILTNAFHNVKVKIFLVPTDFPHRDLDQDYKEMVRSWIQFNITRCAMNVFVFDELDKASPGVLKGLHDVLLNIRSNVHPSERKWTLFILISNSRAKDINSYSFNQLSEGRERISLSYEELQPVILKNSAETWYGAFHEDSLIDEYVPFLPLNRDHVHQCIKRELYRKGRTINKKIIELVDGELSFVQPYEKSKHYSTTGCKRVPDKVDFHYPKL